MIWLCIALAASCAAARPPPASPLESDEESEAISDDETDQEFAMAEPTKLPKLPPRGAAFVQARLAGAEPTEAAERAGFQKGVAAEAGKRLDAHPAVRASIRVARLAEFDGASVLLELAGIAFFDPAEMYDEMGRLKAMREMPERVRRSISHIDKDGVAKGYDKVRALELLGKHFGVISDKVRLEGQDGGPIVFSINGVIKE